MVDTHVLRGYWSTLVSCVRISRGWHLLLRQTLLLYERFAVAFLSGTTFSTGAKVLAQYQRIAVAFLSSGWAFSWGLGKVATVWICIRNLICLPLHWEKFDMTIFTCRL